ncbi:12S rRNA N4-methylcytidine m4C methyltransferase [Taenia crassiceps]|uniref:12S rRNA N4-methylcytidine m4C methyltransferase n=1 Tax=Taenia crassiceps TaxID=6207 RepID=A0ABR4QT97_9CEST
MATGRAFSRCSTRLLNLAANSPHIPVLVSEVIEYLRPRRGQRFVDLTFGAGGHTRALLAACAQITVFCLDRDPLAARYAQELASSTSGRVVAVQGRFSQALDLLSQVDCRPGSVDGVVMDIGASSMQMDSPTRGFGVSRDAPLDMRMTTSNSLGSGHEKDEALVEDPSAADVLNELSASHLARIFRVYGEERFARRIANAVVEYRSTLGPLRTTSQLANLVASVVSPLGQRTREASSGQSSSHLATQVFQALRIFVNDELNELCTGLEAAHRLLRPGGRAAIISFHSLEDRLVKRAFAMRGCHAHGLAQCLADSSSVESSYRYFWSEQTPHLWGQVAGPIRPTSAEVHVNRRSRSAKLRVGEKMSCE